MKMFNSAHIEFHPEVEVEITRIQIDETMSDQYKVQLLTQVNSIQYIIHFCEEIKLM